ncbi:MAG: TolC family protein [Bacteroidetes bacterium]|nr:TolC family protein [Bacteroidota bacterium]
MKRSIIIALLTLAVLVNGQEKLSLSVEQAVQTGLENSKALKSSQFKVVAAEAKTSEASALGLPSLKLNAVYTRLSDLPSSTLTTPFGVFEISPSILNNYTVKATVQQPLFTGNKISGASDIADFSYEATKQDFSKDKADLIYNIKNAYWNLYRANEFKKVVDENVGQIRSHAVDAENMMKQGLLTNNDLLKVQVQLSDALVRQIDAKNNVTLAMLGLNNTLGLPLSTQIEITSQLESNLASSVDVSSLVKKAVENRPEILGMNARVKASESNLSIARSGWYPQIFLVGNYNYLRPNQRIFPSKDEFKGTWDVSISLSYDLWNWNTSGNQSTQAEAQLSQTEQALSQLKDGVSLEVTQSYLAVNQAKERSEVAKKGVEQAEENYRVTNERYKKGLNVNSDLLDSEVALLTAKLNYTQSLVDFELASARLTRSIGE